MLKKLFQYNWKVRDEWFELCKQISIEDLLRKRVGGAGNILYTLFHIAESEYSWIRGIQGKQDIQVQFEINMTLQQIKELSDSWSIETHRFIKTWSIDFENEIVTASWMDRGFTQGEILRHLIAHEIHHIGQLSIWVRDLGLQPVSASVIGRGLG
jgi:uncharacterized damage-inducible protein DinB